jgi:glycosyltransferase involved in cell wall biosynthesis
VINKKVLIISDWAPYPVENGMQLPIAEYVRILRNSISFDLFLICNNDLEDNVDISDSVPYFNHIKNINTKRKSKFSRIISEIFLNEPFYSEFDFEDFDVSSYDTVWVSNAKIASLAKKRMFNNSNLLLSTHDAIYYAHYERLKFSLFRNNFFSVSSIVNLLRLPFILLNERSYLKKYNCIQVQTNLEKSRLELIGNNDLSKKIHVVPNGIKQDLYTVIPNLDTNNILYMSHMILGKEKEVIAFLDKIWKRLMGINPKLNLFIVGSLPSNFDAKIYSQYDNVHFVGFVKSLKDIFDDKSLTIIPNFQSSGLINRLYDTICAGVPFVISDKIAQTHEGIEKLNIGKIAYNDDDFIKMIIQMFDDRNLLKTYSTNAKTYAFELNSWEMSAHKLGRLL